jgi:ubiquinone/menaquinone biosynthesis C-methylase UbiE/uncharacterized protein YbaR (Trm112 family)
MGISAEQERAFEIREISKRKERYLATNTVERYAWDRGYRRKIELIRTALTQHGIKGYVLDVGASTAGESEVLFHLGFKMVATDINQVALKFSKDRAWRFRKEEMPYYAVDAHSLPFASSTFDAVVAYATLHHMENIDAALGELYRVLRPGGVLFTYEPYAYNPYRRLSEVRDYFKGTIEKSFSMRGLVTLLEEAGFRVSRAEKIVLPPSDWKKRQHSRARAALKDLYFNVSRVLPWLFGNLVAVAQKPGEITGELNDDLEHRLVCPVTGSELRREHDAYVAESGSKRVRYPMHHGIPVLIKQDAEQEQRSAGKAEQSRSETTAVRKRLGSDSTA